MWGIQNLWPHLHEELDADVEYVQKGNLRLGKTAAHMQILQKLTDSAVKCGLDVRMIDAQEVRRINPYLSEEVIGASWCPTDGHANPMKTTLAYYRKARTLGVRFITGEKVVRLEKIHGKLRKVITEKNVYEAEKVLVAAGYESREIIRTVGIDIPMIKQKMQCLVTEAEPRMFEQMLGTAEADFYGHQSSHGSFVFGGSSGQEGYESDKDRLIASSISVPCICRGILKYFPGLAETKIVRAWTGWIDPCVDGIPVMSNVEEAEGLYLATGFSGHGFGIAPAAGYHLSQMICEEEPVVDMRAFRYDRFKAKI